jgi:hypothetical protein
MKGPRDFYAQEGQAIIPLLNRFARFVKADSTISISGEARVMKTAKGRRVIYDPAPQSFPGSFRVSLPGGNKISVGEGLVSGMVPYMDGRRIDGLLADGEPDPLGKPTLLLTEPDAGDRSFVMLRVKVDAAGEIGEAKNQTPDDPIVEIVHRDELPAGMVEEGKAARLVAVIYWAAGRIRSVRQVVYYDQEVVPAGGRARFRASA